MIRQDPTLFILAKSIYRHGVEIILCTLPIHNITQNSTNMTNFSKTFVRARQEGNPGIGSTGAKKTRSAQTAKTLDAAKTLLQLLHSESDETIAAIIAKKNQRTLFTKLRKLDLDTVSLLSPANKLHCEIHLNNLHTKVEERGNMIIFSGKTSCHTLNPLHCKHKNMVCLYGDRATMVEKSPLELAAIVGLPYKKEATKTLQFRIAKSSIEVFLLRTVQDTALYRYNVEMSKATLGRLVLEREEEKRNEDAEM